MINDTMADQRRVTELMGPSDRKGFFLLKFAVFKTSKTDIYH